MSQMWYSIVDLTSTLKKNCISLGCVVCDSPQMMIKYTLHSWTLKNVSYTGKLTRQIPPSHQSQDRTSPNDQSRPHGNMWSTKLRLWCTQRGKNHSALIFVFSLKCLMIKLQMEHGLSICIWYSMLVFLN